jgi:osmotically inducible lipoprotein OsmB
MSRNITNLLVFAALGLALAGCGHQPGERAVSGGLIGAGAGAVIGSVTGIGPVGGAVIGGAVGAVGGAATSPHDVNLGRPVWHQHD